MSHPRKVIITCAFISQSVAAVEAGTRPALWRSTDQLLGTVEQGTV